MWMTINGNAPSVTTRRLLLIINHIITHSFYRFYRFSSLRKCDVRAATIHRTMPAPKTAPRTESSSVQPPSTATARKHVVPNNPTFQTNLISAPHAHCVGRFFVAEAKTRNELQPYETKIFF